MPLPIQNARISKLIHDAYNIVGRYRARIDETVVPVVVVDDFSEGGGFPEVRKAAARAFIGSVVGEFAVARFETPANVLAVVRQLSLIGGGNDSLHVFFGSSIVAPATAAPKAFIDGRIRNRGETPAGVLASDTQVAALATVHMQIPVISTNGRVVDVEWPIGQVAAFDFVEFLFDRANSLLDISLTWDEYLVRP